MPLHALTTTETHRERDPWENEGSTSMDRLSEMFWPFRQVTKVHGILDQSEARRRGMGSVKHRFARIESWAFVDTTSRSIVSAGTNVGLESTSERLLRLSL